MRYGTTRERLLLRAFTHILLPVCGLLAAGVAVAGAGDPPAEKVLPLMRQAFQAEDGQRLKTLLPQVAGHRLEPLAAYWTLKVGLKQAPAEEVWAFLERYRDSYYEDRLRNDWLLELGKRGDWDTFRQALPGFRMRDDREVSCYALLAQTDRPTRDWAAEAGELWLAQKKADDGCLAAVSQAYAERQLPATVLWQRARWAVESNRPQAAAQAVGLVDKAWLPVLQSLMDNPARYLGGKVTALRQPTKEIVTLALIRLATQTPEAAAEQMDRLRWKVQLTPEERSWVHGVIGKRLALRLSPDATDAFAHARNEHLNDDLLVWKARAALRAGHWRDLAQTIEAMREPLRQTAVWQYWLARAWQATDGEAGNRRAQAVYERIAGTGGFYEQLALDALGQQVTTPPRPAPLTAAERQAIRQNPGLQRALLAIELDLRSEGVREWNYEVALHQPGGLPERELLAAADLACEHQIWDRCINTSARTQDAVHAEQRFPTPYRSAVVTRAKEIGLDPAYVYGLIRQESRFVTQARSHVGAAGLMQVMPATARWTAKRIGLHPFNPDQITDRDTNITIGTAYLKLALDDFEGSMAMAAAAYNAGPGRVRNWRNGPLLEAAVWIENIPFDETRTYVQNVLANTTQYAALITGQPQSLSQRLRPIGPRGLGASAPLNDLP